MKTVLLRSVISISFDTVISNKSEHSADTVAFFNKDRVQYVSWKNN